VDRKRRFRLDELAVDGGAITTLEVRDEVLALAAGDASMFTRDGGHIDDDIAIAIAAEDDAIFFHRDACPLVGPLEDEQRSHGKTSGDRLGAALPHRREAHPGDGGNRANSNWAGKGIQEKAERTEDRG